MLTLKIGSRPSPLAIKQVEEISSLLPEILVKIIPIETRGDRDKTTHLSEMEGTNFFTHEIEKALISGHIDAAIHSAKDLESSLPDGLMIAAITHSISPFECLVSRGNIRLENLPFGAIIGTSSVKRKEAIIRFRSDLVVKDIRGDIDERLKQLDSGKFDALIIAHAALIRMGYEHRIAQIISEEIIKPHPLQGALAIEVRQNNPELVKLLSDLDTRKAEKYA